MGLELVQWFFYLVYTSLVVFGGNNETKAKTNDELSHKAFQSLASSNTHFEDTLRGY